MFKCTENDKKEILEYIGESYGKCLYLYVDLLKYGFDDENINVWVQREDGKVKALLLQYYTGVHIFAQDSDFDVAQINKIIQEINPSMICGMKATIEKVRQSLENYKMEVGLVGELKELKMFETEGCYKAEEKEIKELADLLSTDESLGKPYGFDLLYKQLVERYRDRFGRNFIYRVNGKIVATASTYAEQSGVAVISGVMVHPDYRGKGLSKNILSAICKDLKEDGFKVFSYYYIAAATKMHEAVGFESIGEWAKLVRNDQKEG